MSEPSQPLLPWPRLSGRGTERVQRWLLTSQVGPGLLQLLHWAVAARPLPLGCGLMSPKSLLVSSKFSYFAFTTSQCTSFLVLITARNDFLGSSLAFLMLTPCPRDSFSTYHVVGAQQGCWAEGDGQEWEVSLITCGR